MMRLSKRKIKWALRQLYVPVSNQDLVLEVGSGGSPYPRSDILLDAFETTRERHWMPLVADRPTILAFGEKLPFKDKAFNFVIASHVLEHSPYPEQFLSELQRVAHAGYIETPDAFMERVNPYKDHRLEITIRNNELIIYKKEQWIVDPEIVEFYEHRVKRIMTRYVMPMYPEEFHARYYWKNTINYQIINQDVDASWQPADEPISNACSDYGAILRQFVYSFIRKLFYPGRIKIIDLIQLLQCPKCNKNRFTVKANGIQCVDCLTTYQLRDRLLIMTEGGIL